jgi:outer membrane lipoprotein carrier protein
MNSRRNISKRLGPCVWLALVCVSAFAVAETEVSRVAARVDAHYDHLHTLQANFTETYTGAGISRSESGTLWLKRPGRMRWEYRQPREKLFLSDGSTAWFYVPGEKQARKTAVKKLEDLRSPLAYLLGRTKLQKEFTGLSVAQDVSPEAPGDVVLRGVPRRMGNIDQVLMEITPDGRFVRILVAQDDGSTTDFRFVNEQENVPIPDQRFHFSPPPGVETVEAGQLDQ